MLIINADDLGRNEETTDAIVRCHARGRITSTSAMVFMADSERGAKLALSSGIDVGLHINLSEQFTAAVPQSLRESHNQICRFLKKSKYALLIYNPLLSRQFREVCDAQREEFERLYGRQPSHFDGHQHMHLASNVVIGHLLPSGAKVRRSFSFRAGEKGLLNRMYRSVLDWYLARRHVLTDHFFSLAHYGPIERLKSITKLAKAANVELMTHPVLSEESELLSSDPYLEALQGVKLGTYAQLTAR